MGLFIPLVATDLTLYSRAMCSWCMDAKDYLAERERDAPAGQKGKKPEDFLN
jgi:glutaredoxin